MTRCQNGHQQSRCMRCSVLLKIIIIVGSSARDLSTSLVKKDLITIAYPLEVKHSNNYPLRKYVQLFLLMILYYCIKVGYVVAEGSLQPINGELVFSQTHLGQNAVRHPKSINQSLIFFHFIKHFLIESDS